MKDLPVRKGIRLKEYDYSWAGCYFITICVKEKHEMLGKVVGDGVLDVPHVQLSEYGNTIEKHIAAINAHYNQIAIQKHIVMPNHVHMLISVKDGDGCGCGTSRTPSPTNAVIPALVSTLKCFVSKDCGFSFWQRAYHDRVIRGHAEYQRVWQYIDENPLRWAEDEYHP